MSFQAGMHRKLKLNYKEGFSFVAEVLICSCKSPATSEALCTVFNVISYYLRMSGILVNTFSELTMAV